MNDDLNADYLQSKDDQTAREANSIYGEVTGQAPAAPTKKPLAWIGGGPLEFGKQIVGGVRDAIVEANRSVGDLAGWISEKTGLPKGGRLASKINDLPEVSAPQGIATGIARSASQFLTGFLPATRVVRGLGA